MSEKISTPFGCNLDTIKPSPKCFGQWQGLDSEKCKACHIWGYCADLEARTATIRNAALDEAMQAVDQVAIIYGVGKQLRTHLTRSIESLRTQTQEPHP